jgi:hypothetical protein
MLATEDTRILKHIFVPDTHCLYPRVLRCSKCRSTKNEVRLQDSYVIHCIIPFRKAIGPPQTDLVSNRGLYPLSCCTAWISRLRHVSLLPTRGRLNYRLATNDTHRTALRRLQPATTAEQRGHPVINNGNNGSCQTTARDAYLGWTVYRPPFTTYRRIKRKGSSCVWTLCATLLQLTNGQITLQRRGTRWHSWLRHCATNRKVVGSIPDGVIGIFHWHNPCGRTMALGSTQPLTEMSTRNISWG